MKKVMTTALALILTLGMSVTAFAAGSISTSVSGVTEDGTVVTVTTLDEATTAQGTEQAASMVGAGSSVLEAVEVTLPTTVSASNPVTIGFTAPTVTSATTKVYALHRKADGNWEKLDVAIRDGKAYVTFTSLSPVIFVAEAASTNAGASAVYNPGQYDQYQTSGQNQAAGVTSPKTADADSFMLVLTVLASGAALVVLNRKKAA